MYRPQFPYPPPPSSCEDQPCLYSYDFTNTPVFAGTLAAGVQTGRIPLRLDKDADFYLRAIRTFHTNPRVLIRIEDTDGNQLSDSENAVNRTNFEEQPQYSFTHGAGFAPLESGADGVYGPAGGNYVVYLFNNSGTTASLNTLVITLVGVKRYSGDICK